MGVGVVCVFAYGALGCTGGHAEEAWSVWAGSQPQIFCDVERMQRSVMYCTVIATPHLRSLLDHRQSLSELLVNTAEAQQQRQQVEAAAAAAQHRQRYALQQAQNPSYLPGGICRALIGARINKEGQC